MKKTIISLAFFLFMGCAFTSNTGSIQRAEKSYLKFLGNHHSVSVTIDNNNSFNLSTTEDKLYQLSPGKHTLKIYRNNNLIVTRIIFLEDHGTMEIIIPWKIKYFIY